MFFHTYYILKNEDTTEGEVKLNHSNVDNENILIYKPRMSSSHDCETENICVFFTRWL